jgi:hypothetical protein
MLTDRAMPLLMVGHVLAGAPVPAPSEHALIFARWLTQGVHGHKDAGLAGKENARNRADAMLAP